VGELSPEEARMDLDRPTPLEVSAGWALGMGAPGRPAVLDHQRQAPGPRAALERILMPALARAPCVVDFSGGRDSSLVLAVAAQLARREGLPLPVPRTRRFPADAATGEDHWQELVVAHLGLPDWQISRFTDELDLVGERAQAFLRRYGLLVPSTFYVLAASLELARGGSHLTGEGGDEVFRPGPLRIALSRLAPPAALAHPRRAVSAMWALAPRPARTWRLARSYAKGSSLPCAGWLQPGALSLVACAWGRHLGTQPSGWADSLGWHLRQRAIVSYKHNLRLIAADYAAVSSSPLLDESFVAALARAGGRLGFASRQEAMEFVAGDLLPPALFARKTKATFNTAYFAGSAHELARRWDGGGVDPGLVDSSRLRQEWLKERPSAASSALLQAAWLAQAGVGHAPEPPSAPRRSGRAGG
jgi:hypothetical protein